MTGLCVCANYMYMYNYCQYLETPDTFMPLAVVDGVFHDKHFASDSVSQSHSKNLYQMMKTCKCQAPGLDMKQSRHGNLFTLNTIFNMR